MTEQSHFDTSFCRQSQGRTHMPRSFSLTEYNGLWFWGKKKEHWTLSGPWQLDWCFRLSRAFVAVVWDCVLYNSWGRAFSQVHSSLFQKVWCGGSCRSLPSPLNGMARLLNRTLLAFRFITGLVVKRLSSWFLCYIFHRQLTRWGSLLAKLPRLFWQSAMMAVRDNSDSTCCDANCYRQRSLFLPCLTRPIMQGLPCMMPIIVSVILWLIPWWVLVVHVKAEYIYRMTP
jgi:hypothetical protein